MAPPSHKSCKYRLSAIAVIGILFFVLAGCLSIPAKVDKFKKLHHGGRFEELTAMDVSCDADAEGCNQLHLIKGDACFRLAKTSTDMGIRRSNLNCAAGELTMGIELTKAWEDISIDRTRVYENACEAARLCADFGDRARFEALLAANAERFRNFAPDHPGAIFYSARAEFFTLTQSQNPCNGLRTLRARVDAALRRFQTDSRYRVPYQSLNSTIVVEQRMRCSN